MQKREKHVDKEALFLLQVQKDLEGLKLKNFSFKSLESMFQCEGELSLNVPVLEFNFGLEGPFVCSIDRVREFIFLINITDSSRNTSYLRKEINRPNEIAILTENNSISWVNTSQPVAGQNQTWFFKPKNMKSFDDLLLVLTKVNVETGTHQRYDKIIQSQQDQKF